MGHLRDHQHSERHLSVAHPHHDDHHHAHEAGLLGRLSHVVAEMVGGHSHDSAEQVDEALEANAAGRRALWVSLVPLP